MRRKKLHVFPLNMNVCLEWHVRMLSSFSSIWGFWESLHLEGRTQNEICLRVPVISRWEDCLCSSFDSSPSSTVCGRGCAFSTSFRSWRLPSLRREAMTATRCTTSNSEQYDQMILCRCLELARSMMSRTLSSETSRWPPSQTESTHAYIVFIKTHHLIILISSALDFWTEPAPGRTTDINIPPEGLASVKVMSLIPCFLQLISYFDILTAVDNRTVMFDLLHFKQKYI